MAIVLVAMTCLTACRTKDKNDPVPVTPVKDHGTLNVSFVNRADGKVIVNGSMNYRNTSGNTYSITLMKYLVSNFTLIKNDNSEQTFNNYKLVNGLDSSTWNLTLDSVANGSYKAIRFYLGVDSVHNHTIMNEGDLNPSNGMVWTWSTGYIFFKHEGAYKNDTGSTQTLLYHFGTDAALVTVDIPVTQFNIKGDSKTLYLGLDLNDLYAAPNAIDFTNNNTHQSMEARDKTWLANLKGNFPQAFKFVKVQ